MGLHMRTAKEHQHIREMYSSYDNQLPDDMKCIVKGCNRRRRSNEFCMAHYHKVLHVGRMPISCVICGDEETSKGLCRLHRVQFGRFFNEYKARYGASV